jgi:hypothetical protein
LPFFSRLHEIRACLAIWLAMMSQATFHILCP